MVSVSRPWPESGSRPLNAAIVGGGKGCESVLKMVEAGALGRFKMRILGVADPDSDARGVVYARHIGIPHICTTLSALYKIENLDLLIELTGKDAVRDEIERTRPRHIKLIDHFGARLFWEVQQVSDQVEAERARIAQILDSIPDEIVVVDTEMTIKDANSSYLNNNNLKIDDVVGCHCYDVGQELRGECQVAVQNCPFFTVMKDRQPCSIVRKHFDSQGNARYASIVGAPWMDKDGNVIGMIEMIRDITSRIQLEEELAEKEVRLRQFMELAPLATYVKNRSGQYIDVNPAACTLFGKKQRDILGRTDLEIFNREAAIQMKEGDRAAWQKRNAVSFDTAVQLFDRKAFLSTTKFPILDAKGNPTAVCTVTKDITAQKVAEIQLNETREYLQQILDDSPVIIVTTNLKGEVVSFNKGACESLGYSSEEIIGKHASIFYHEPSQREELLRLVVSGKAVRDYSTELIRKDGTAVPVSITLSQLRDTTGKMIGTVGISKDISHRKTLMSQILQSERMAAVGRLASGVAHEINNPLAVIGEIAGYLLDILSSKQQDDQEDLLAELEEGLPKIVKQVKRGRTITQRLLSFARKSDARVTISDVHASLDEILPFLEKEARLAQVVIERQYYAGSLHVPVEEMQLQEIFINLITNAIHALAGKGGGTVWLRTYPEDGKVIITIKDNGPGIDDSVRERLFDPFVTTKPSGQGTGLGLSICYGIVKRYDGEIRVDSEPGKGATFKVIFPRTTQTRAQDEPQED